MEMQPYCIIPHEKYIPSAPKVMIYVQQKLTSSPLPDCYFLQAR